MEYHGLSPGNANDKNHAKLHTVQSEYLLLLNLSPGPHHDHCNMGAPGIAQYAEIVLNDKIQRAYMSNHHQRMQPTRVDAT